MVAASRSTPQRGPRAPMRIFVDFWPRDSAEVGSPSMRDWPGKKVLDSRAAGLFIWAETVIRFVEQVLTVTLVMGGQRH